MVWKADAPQCYESSKIRWDTVPYTRGLGLDVGCGPEKIWPQAIGIDNRKDTGLFGIQMNPDITVPDATDIGLFATNSVDWLYSSHTLEHIPDHKKALKEWWRVVKDGGYMLLYLPHKNLYPNIGQPGSNPDHRHDFLPSDIIEVMKEVGGWDLVVNEDRNADNEYSFFQVFKKYSDKGLHRFSCNEPKPAKRAAVIRYGAWGDVIQASSIFPWLKEQGYHITLYTVPRAWEVVKHDPHIDAVVLQEPEQVPNPWLGHFWAHLKKKYDYFVNFSESVEGSLLALPDRVHFHWSKEARHRYMNHNYLEETHAIAEVPYERPRMRFHATEDEKRWAAKERRTLGAAPLILWVLSGSSVHKVYPYLDKLFPHILKVFPEAKIVTVGDHNCKTVLEPMWADEPRIVKRSGDMSIRETMALAQVCDLVIGPETGVMSAMAMEAMPKIVLLSHSTVENLTRDWVNTHSLASTETPCYPCHKQIYTWDQCNRFEKTGAAHCMSHIKPDDVWKSILTALEVKLEAANG